MRIRSIIAASAALLVAAAVPAHAYNADAYSYGAGHMVNSKQVPSSLNMKTGGYFSASPVSGKNWLCGDSESEVRYPGGQYNFNISYTQKQDGPGSVNVNVNQFASNVKAEAAWKSLTSGLEKCSGEKSGTETYEDGSTDTWARNTTVGNVPMVTVTGVVSKFMNTNYTDTTTGEYASNYTSDNYTVYSLVGDVIIATNYYTGSELNLTAAQRKAVNQVAFNAVGAWVD